MTATNDVNGSIDFGKIVFTLDALNKALGTTQQGATADTGAASIQSAAPAANDVVAAGHDRGRRGCGRFRNACARRRRAMILLAMLLMVRRMPTALAKVRFL